MAAPLPNPWMDEARENLAEAVAGLDLDEAEQRILAWVRGWDVDTLNAIASVIRKARQS